MPKYIVSLLQKTSNDAFMTDKKPELSAAMKSKLEPKKFTKILFLELSLQLQSLVQKGVLENLHLQRIWL